MAADRYALRALPGEKYPLVIVDTATEEVVARYLATSEKSAERHCEDRNREAERLEKYRREAAT